MEIFWYALMAEYDDISIKTSNNFVHETIWIESTLSESARSAGISVLTMIYQQYGACFSFQPRWIGVQHVTNLNMMHEIAEDHLSSCYRLIACM